MDTTTFRWILIITGIVIVTGLFLLGHPDRKRKPRASRKQSRAPRQRREPALFAGDPAAARDSDEGGGNGQQAELPIGDDTGDDGRIEPSMDTRGDVPSRHPAAPLPEKIITIFIEARDNHVISGVQLLDAALKSGLVFGSHDIFHRVDEDNSGAALRPVFSMANLTKPGNFNKSEWSTLETRGVTLFMTLPGPRMALDAWDAMLATSRRLAELLHADLLDESQQPLTRQRTLQIKEELRKYDRQMRSGQKPESP